MVQCAHCNLRSARNFCPDENNYGAPFEAWNVNVSTTMTRCVPFRHGFGAVYLTTHDAQEFYRVSDVTASYRVLPFGANKFQDEICVSWSCITNQTLRLKIGLVCMESRSSPVSDRSSLTCNCLTSLSNSS